MKERMETVKLIYGDFLAGLSCYAIAEKLTAMGVKTPAGKDKWSQGTVKRILQKPDTRERIRCKLEWRGSEALIIKGFLGRGLHFGELSTGIG